MGISQNAKSNGRQVAASEDGEAWNSGICLDDKSFHSAFWNCTRSHGHIGKLRFPGTLAFPFGTPLASCHPTPGPAMDTSSCWPINSSIKQVSHHSETTKKMISLAKGYKKTEDHLQCCQAQNKNTQEVCTGKMGHQPCVWMVDGRLDVVSSYKPHKTHVIFSKHPRLSPRITLAL